MNIAKQKEKLLKWNKAYRGGKPLVSDEEFDRELGELSKYDEIGAFQSFKQLLFEHGGSITHEYVMGSLNKVKYKEGDFSKWCLKYNVKKIIISEKLDGCSFVAKYTGGKFISGASRGDGMTGADWTAKLRYILPKKIAIKNPITIRGELVICDGKEAIFGYKNARNGVVGIMNDDNINESKLAIVTAIVYDILDWDLKAEAIFDVLEGNFRIPQWRIINIDRIDVVEEALKTILLDWRAAAPYLMDGLVIAAADYKNENVYHPERKIAFKVNSEGYPTKIVDIEWNISKTGAIKPTLILQPVEIDGTTVKRANGCNARMCLDKGTGVGAEVLIIKSGEIVPKVVGVIKEKNPQVPLVCPSCGAQTQWKGVDLICPANCGESQVLKLASFLRDCGVENVTEKSLVKWGIQSFEDMLEFSPDTKSKAQVKFAEALIDHVFSKPAQVLFSKMYFEGAGERTINKIFAHYKEKTVRNLSDFAYSVNSTLPAGIGMKTLDKMAHDWDYNMNILEMIISDERWNPAKAEKGFFKEPNEENVIINPLPLAGWTFLFTGTLSKPRKHFEQLVEAAGGQLASSVSKNLTYLVVGSDAGSKLAKAEKLGVKILNEEEFMRKLK